MRDKLRKFLPLLLVGALATLALACDPTEPVSWVNETSIEVYIYSGDSLDDFELSLPPNSSESPGMLESLWNDLVVIRDEQGNVLLRQQITWDELEAQDFRFVITPEMLSPEPAQHR